MDKEWLPRQILNYKPRGIRDMGRPRVRWRTKHNRSKKVAVHVQAMTTLLKPLKPKVEDWTGDPPIPRREEVGT